MKLFKRKGAGVLAAVATTCLIAAGCGSSSSNTTSSSSGGSKSAIVVGNIGDYSGPQAGSIGGAQQVIKAWAQSVNAAGGINGHPIELIVKDDAENPTTALADVKELIQQDHVVAIVGDQSGDDAQWASVASSAGVPVVGGLSIDLPFVTNPDFFPSGTNVIAATYGVIQNAKAIGPKMALLYCAEAPQCASASTLYKALGQVVGVDLPYIASVSATAPDYTDVCQAIKNSGAQSYEIADASNVVIRVAEACAQQGVTAKQVTDDGTVTTPWLSVPALDGTVSAETDFPWTDNSVPATQAYQTAIAKYAPGLGAQNGPNASYAWVSGQLFEAAVKAIPSGSAITSASVKQGLYALHNDNLGGLAPPLTFTQGKPTAVNCWFTLGINGGKVTEPKGLNSSCAPDALISGVLSKLAG
jgi:branched-chain amino acid transport system substrate-binding protein